MKVGNDPRDWGDFVCPKDESNAIAELLKTIGKIFGQSK